MPEKEKRSKYDWLRIPIGALEYREVGKAFNDPAWEEKFNQYLKQGYEVHSASLSDRDVLFVFVK